MADVHHLPDPKRVEHEASEWIARLHADDVSAQDRARFEAWLSAQPLHARIYDELASTWQKFAAAGPFVRAVSFAQAVNESARTRRRWIPAAATVAAALVLAVVALLHYVTGEAKFATAIGEQASISLPDGSTMQLNSDSAARVDYSAHVRVIRLDRGEAFFKVAHDTRRPFWVIGGHSWVRAVGTAFDVYLRPGAVQVTVSEGTVKVAAAAPLFAAAPSDEALARVAVSALSAGHQAELQDGTMTTRRLSTADLARSMAWREGAIYFDNRPLGDVVNELGRYTTLTLVISDPGLRQLAVGGTFQASPQGADALLVMLEQGLGLRVRREQDKVFIERATDGPRDKK